MESQRPIHLVTIVGGRRDAPVEGDATRWRPTLALVEHFRPARIELITVAKFAKLAADMADEVGGLVSGTEVTLHPLSADPGWDFAANYAALLDVARRTHFDPEHEDVLIHVSNGNFPAQIALFLLTRSHDLPGRLVSSADRRVANPFTIIDLDLARYDDLAERFATTAREAGDFLKQGIATRNPRFNRMIERLEVVVTRAPDPLLLMGPTGCGKSELARRCYELLRARGAVNGPFVEINCATLRGDTAASALFGHDRGSFTGADQTRLGCLREAKGGVLFLDEIGELPLDVQAAVLMAVERKRVRPVGADRDVECDFRLIAGTNRDLGRVDESVFRPDLLARIDLWPFSLPRLADRPEDIEPNLVYELERLSAEFNVRMTMNRDARAAFLEFALAAPWPANFREFGGCLRRMAILSGGRISVPYVAEEIERLRAKWSNREPVAAPVAPARQWPPPTPLTDERLGARAAELDVLERVKVETVLLACMLTKNACAAGRLLRAMTGEEGTKQSDGNRVEYVLAKYGIDRRDIWP